jgi:hypothetical protein
MRASGPGAAGAPANALRRLAGAGLLTNRRTGFVLTYAAPRTTSTAAETYAASAHDASGMSTRRERSTGNRYEHEIGDPTEHGGAEPRGRRRAASPARLRRDPRRSARTRRRARRCRGRPPRARRGLVTGRLRCGRLVRRRSATEAIAERAGWRREIEPHGGEERGQRAGRVADVLASGSAAEHAGRGRGRIDRPPGSNRPDPAGAPTSNPAESPRIQQFLRLG